MPLQIRNTPAHARTNSVRMIHPLGTRAQSGAADPSPASTGAAGMCLLDSSCLTTPWSFWPEDKMTKSMNVGSHSNYSTLLAFAASFQIS